MVSSDHRDLRGTKESVEIEEILVGMGHQSLDPPAHPVLLDRSSTRPIGMEPLETQDIRVDLAFLVKLVSLAPSDQRETEETLGPRAMESRGKRGNRA